LEVLPWVPSPLVLQISEISGRWVMVSNLILHHIHILHRLEVADTLDLCALGVVAAFRILLVSNLRIKS
jgi:hypothetical protein